MLKFSLPFLILILLISSCSEHKLDQDVIVKEIVVLQKRAKENANDSTLIYLKKADHLIKNLKITPDSLAIENVFRKGYYYYQVEKLDSAVYFFHKTIDLINVNSIPRKRDLDYFRNTWELDLKLGKYANGTAAANKYIELRNEDYKGLQFAYGFHVEVNQNLKNYERALVYNDKAQEIAKRSNDEEMSTLLSSSKARMLYMYLNKKEAAFKILDSLTKNDNRYTNEVNRQLYRDYGILNFYDANYKKAIKNYKKSFRYFKNDDKKFNENFKTLEAYLNISEAYIELKDLEKANTYLDSASLHVNSQSSNEHLAFLGELRFKLSYLNDNDFTETLSVYNDIIRNQNKVYQEKMDEDLLDLISANERQRLLSIKNQESEIERIKLKSRLLFLLIFTLLVSIIGFLFYRQRRFKFEKQSLQMQQRLLRSQMNPHFTSNILYAIQNQIKEDAKGAITYLLKFSRLLRIILENSMQNYVPLEDELESLRKYLDLQLLRFPEKYTYEIILNDIEEEDLLFIPPMLMQPFVENSIEHGFSGIDYKGAIKLILSLNNKYISCTIKDNGMGYDSTRNLNKKSASLQLISDFIFKATKEKITIKNRNEISEDQKGTQVKFLIPYKHTADD